MKTNLHLWLIPVLPLIGAFINGFFGSRFPRKVVTAIAWIFPGLAFAQALWVSSGFAQLERLPYIETHGPWVQISGFVVNFGFYLDQLSLVMLLVVTGVGFLIHIYSAGYMAHEGGYYRFFAYLNLFMFFMLVLVLANNYLLMFVGWEGVGLASYLLIGFYFLKHSAAQAGKKAFIVNRIGDFAFLIGMFMLVKTFGAGPSGSPPNLLGAANALDYEHIFRAIGNNAELFAAGTAGATILTIVGFCLLIGATGKSAQIPLYVWLPDAMEGPTPVSALIHAATMVTAGVYMVARSNMIFNHAPAALTAVAVVGAVTAIFAASIGMLQTDIKRVLAYSTVSQLGYMFLACGVAAYSAAIFHLMTHAFFKALLFLAAGSVIHALSGEQDMRNMGGLRKLIPWTFAVMAVGTIAIAGIPPLAGFVSKDEILWKAYSSGARGWIFWSVGILTAAITSFYMFRLLFMTFFGERRHTKADHLHEAHVSNVHHAHAPHGHGEGPHHGSSAQDHNHGGVHESPWVMLGPLVILAVLAIIGGWVGWPHALGGENQFEKFLQPVFSASSAAYHDPGGAPLTTPAGHGNVAERATTESHSEEVTERLLTAISVAVALMGLALAWLMYVRRPELSRRIADRAGALYRTVLNKYYVDEAYQATFVEPILEASTKGLWRGIDVGVIDGAVNSAGTSAQYFSDRLRRMQSGNIRSYAGWVAIGAAVLLAYVIWMGI